MKKHGVDVPAGMKLKVVENTESVYHLVLPSAPSAHETELGEAELSAAAGGAARVLPGWTKVAGGATSQPKSGYCKAIPC